MQKLAAQRRELAVQHQHIKHVCGLCFLEIHSRRLGLLFGRRRAGRLRFVRQLRLAHIRLNQVPPSIA